MWQVEVVEERLGEYGIAALSPRPVADGYWARGRRHDRLSATYHSVLSLLEISSQGQHIFSKLEAAQDSAHRGRR